MSGERGQGYTGPDTGVKTTGGEIYDTLLYFCNLFVGEPGDNERAGDLDTY